jgi:hypothetical protein
VHFEIIDQLVIRFCVHVILGKIGNIMGQYIGYLQILKRTMTQYGEKYHTILSMNLVYL